MKPTGRGPICDGAGASSRGRNAAATRQAILDPALVNRYFGSKEGLFTEAISAKFDMSAYFTGDRATLGERLTRSLLKKKAGADPDPLIALLRSSSSGVCGGLMREALFAGFVRPLAAQLDGPDAEQRAELVGSILLGLLVYRTVVRGGAAQTQDDEAIVASVAPTIQGLVDGKV